MNLTDIRAAAEAKHLTPLGGFHEAGTTIVLLGPHEPGFWAHVSKQAEFTSGKDDPLDHWSHRAICALADVTGATPLFPFGGPPHHPFIAWALRSGEAWQSPVGLLVHKDAGLLVSYRGALRFDRHIELTPAARNPCLDCCEQPCLAACPVAALTGAAYDVPACKAHIAVDDVCHAGCRVRLACPISQTYARDPRQTAFHMDAFI